MSIPVQSPQLTPSPQAILFDRILNFWLSRATYVAAKLGIADLLADGPKTASELAAETQTHPGALYRVLRALAVHGIFDQDERQRFRLNAVSELLRSEIPGSLRWSMMSELGEEHFPAWGNLMHSVKTGEIAFDNLFGKNAWQYYAEHPEQGRIFELSMTGLTQTFDRAVLSAYDFSPCRRIIDVGGGHGALLASILKVNTAARGAVFDSAPVIEAAEAAGGIADVEERCVLMAGDFFKAVPPGGDAYLLKLILHDWNDDQCKTILRNIHKAAAPGSKLIVIEMMLKPDQENAARTLMDLNMLVMTGGFERTEAEFAQLFAETGFRLTRTAPAPPFLSIIEAARI